MKCFTKLVWFADYVGFIKKCMKLMQKPDYNMARKIDLEIQQLDDDEAPRTPGTLPCNVHMLLCLYMVFT